MNIKNMIMELCNDDITKREYIIKNFDDLDYYIWTSLKNRKIEIQNWYQEQAIGKTGEKNETLKLSEVNEYFNKLKKENNDTSN